MENKKPLTLLSTLINIYGADCRCNFPFDITETPPYSFGNFRKLSLYNCFMPI